MREIILDTETTGMDPLSGHRIVEIGCVELMGGIRTGEFYHCYLNPERDMPEEAFRVHGLSGDFLKKHPTFMEVVDTFLEFIADSPLVIHNAGFDMRFINAELERLGFKALPMDRAVDTLALARQKFPGAPASLNALCKRFEIDLSARTKHGALLDAELLADVYLELLGGRQVALGLDSKQAAVMASEAAAATLAVSHPPRSFAPSQEEMAAHMAMLAKLKNPLWQA
ncbi:MAG: DNA polymerase III subunit epsilon [Rickettsiales bacterium]|nr:DNA polymerase III subunit epsilon [Rickettsiales bacterium]